MHTDIDWYNVKVCNSKYTKVNAFALARTIECFKRIHGTIWILFLNCKTNKLAQYQSANGDHIIAISIKHLHGLSAEAQKYECLYLVLHEMEHALQHFFQRTRVMDYVEPKIPEKYWQYKFSEKEILARIEAEKNILVAAEIYEKSIQKISNPN